MVELEDLFLLIFKNGDKFDQLYLKLTNIRRQAFKISEIYLDLNVLFKPNSFSLLKMRLKFTQ